MATVDIDLGAYKLGWHDEIEYEFKPEKGLNEDIIRQMSEMKGEPSWMLDQRLKAYRRFLRKPIPQWGGGGALNEIDFDDIYYYIKPAKGQAQDWDMVPEGIKATYEKLGIPQAERKYLAGVTAQYECLRGDVRVYTVDRGMVAIKEVQAGDRVFSLNEKTRNLEVRKVKSAAQTDVRQTFRVEVDGGRVLYATDNHPILTRQGFVEVKDLKAGDEVAVALALPDAGRNYTPERPKGTPEGFPAQTSPKLAWLFGYSVGGGTVDADSGLLTLAADGDTAAILHGTIGSLFAVATELGGGSVRSDHKPFIRWLQRNGLIGDHDVRRVPAWVFGLPLTERAAFLRGLLDGSRQLGLSGALTADVAELAELTGITAPDGRVDYAAIISIDAADVAPVFDIEIDGPHNFVAEGVIVHNSEVVYHRNREDLESMGVLFCDMDTALRDYPEIVKEYFGTVIPANDNKFAALNSAVWSGGSFIYVPPGVHVDQPLQAYFRINSENMGQFERTLIIIDEGAFAHYIEGCSAPVYTTDSLHSAVVEIVVKRGGRCRYTTIQNWSNNVYNLVTKRAAAYADATMEWIDGNIGSRLTMKYPAVWLMEPGAHGEVLSIAFASEGQHQDAGAKMVHAAPNTTSTIVSKSISKNGGRAGYRGLVRVEPGAENSKSFVRCDALILDEKSRSDTYPYMEIEENDAEIGHEATVSKVGQEQLFYLMSRGLTEEQATSMIVAGFIEPIVRELPMEYAVEMNRLIELNMAAAGAVG
ncbi:MAG TPA: Fe-S cluster assembly protein SufB [Acidimicrobiia bacterium]|nr:Fe-S cluster assembly protein SufB [Acidimicrobiia bacterium]